MEKDPKKPKKQPTGDYAVGYCRPPAHTRIPKGKVLNPRGINRKQEPELDAFEKARRRPSRLTQDGEVSTVPSDEAFWVSQMARALAGDKTASKIIAQEWGARRKLAPPPPTAEELAQLDEEAARRQQLSAKICDALDELAAIKGGLK